jgi:hypothetical protein
MMMMMMMMTMETTLLVLVINIKSQALVKAEDDICLKDFLLRGWLLNVSYQ